ncbi:MAG TPA: NAD(P)/FAD-dependent oxidoreductase [Candidatus Saccharimonadales bacterium]|jgi:predicted Rossmann fold flavoprotein|nr:NAD(P)/FAD-dependent oxidoreductase [Candidatus Saccharimonadales bacterium]
MIRKFDVLILGAGAAGLMCAIEAGKRGRRVAILERADRAGKKILISGGGRCNFTNLYCTPENFYSANPHFAKSALARYQPSDFIALVEKHNVPFHEKHLGQLFCDGSAQEIVTMLEEECRAAGVQIFLNCEIKEVRRTDFFIAATGPDEYHAPSLVVATGGLSIPKLGATSLGYDLARQFGLKILETKPALVPLTLTAADRAQYCDLAGVSADVEVFSDHQSFREKMLITHRGLSGPAILQISTYWQGGSPLRIDLAPGLEPTRAIRDGKERNLAAANAALQGILPKRFATRWLDLHAPQGWSNRDLLALEEQIHCWVIMPAGTEGYEKAEVTSGGIDTDELSSKNMESHLVPGLFFVGEVVDVTGHLGGFNFQWAWASAVAAGKAV